MAYSTIEKQRAGAKSYYQRQKDAGLCVKCSQPALEGRILCQYHRDKGAASVAKFSPEQRQGYYRKTMDKLKSDVFNHYGNSCACCGETEPPFLTIDHEHGGGNQHLRAKALYVWLRQNNYPEGFRTLCMNCNHAMGIYGECPHGNLPPQTTNHPRNLVYHREKTIKATEISRSS